MSVSLLMVAGDKGLSFILMSTCLSWLTLCPEVMEKKLGYFFSFFLFSFAQVAVASVGVSFIIISACLSRLTVMLC